MANLTLANISTKPPASGSTARMVAAAITIIPPLPIWSSPASSAWCPRADDTVEIWPLLPDGTWDWFCLDGVKYHGRMLTIIWDEDGTRYQRGAGLDGAGRWKRNCARRKIGETDRETAVKSSVHSVAAWPSFWAVAFPLALQRRAEKTVAHRFRWRGWPSGL